MSVSVDERSERMSQTNVVLPAGVTQLLGASEDSLVVIDRPMQDTDPVEERPKVVLDLVNVWPVRVEPAVAVEEGESLNDVVVLVVSLPLERAAGVRNGEKEADEGVDGIERVGTGEVD